MNWKKFPMTTDIPAMGLILIGGSVFLSSIAQILLKLAMLQFHDMDSISMAASWIPLIELASGLGCYALSMLLWMAALSTHELSFAYPMLGLSYILVYLFAVLLPQLHETASFWKTIGIMCIVIGVALVSKSNKTLD